MSTTAICYGLVIIIAVLAIVAPVSCLKCISCSCGSSNKNYTHCIENELKGEYTCSTWAQCKTCGNNITHCITCPSKRFGPLCTEGEVEHIRKKRSSLSIYSSSHCKNEGSIPNGRVTVFPTPSSTRRFRSEEDDYELPVGTRLHYSCNDGYVLQGAADLTCENNGFWSEEKPPSCIEVKCDNFHPVLNGRVVVYFTSSKKRKRTIDKESGINYPLGTRLHYSCDQGYMLLGDEILSCESNGLWSADEPICIEECGRKYISSNPPSFHGTNTRPGEWPWTVAIAVRERNTTLFLCSGVLLDGVTILTVAHCVRDSRKYILYFGLFSLEPDTKDRAVVRRTSFRILVHPDFNMKTYDNNVALISFKRPVRYTERIQPVCLPTPISTARNLIAGKKGFVSGWEVGTPVSSSKEMSMIQIPVLTNRTCTKTFKKKGATFNITSGMFCAGLRKGIDGFCSMSTGTPMVFYNEQDDRYTLEGLVSCGVGPACEKRENYNVMIRISTFMQWILQEWQA